jgi:hypothetical protein
MQKPCDRPRDTTVQWKKTVSKVVEAIAVLFLRHDVTYWTILRHWERVDLVSTN